MSGVYRFRDLYQAYRARGRRKGGKSVAALALAGSAVRSRPSACTTGSGLAGSRWRREALRSNEGFLSRYCIERLPGGALLLMQCGREALWAKLPPGQSAGLGPSEAEPCPGVGLSGTVSPLLAAGVPDAAGTGAGAALAGSVFTSPVL